MSSIGQASSSVSTIQWIIDDALADYTEATGIDLSKNFFSVPTEHSSSPEAVLQLFQEREKAFKEFRDGDRRLISCLHSTVKVIQAFSGLLGKVVSPVSYPLANALFAGIDILLAAAGGVSSSYDALVELFECLGNFLKRLEIYTDIPPTPILMEVVVKIMVESLSVLALALKQIEQGRLKKFTKKLLGESEIEAVLQRLDRLTPDEARMTVAQTLSVIHSLVGNVKIALEGGQASLDNLVVIHQTLNKMNKTKRQQLRREVQRWLSPPDPSTNQTFVQQARHKGTAAWFFESSVLTEWKAMGSFLWIYGKPGAGKSTLLSAIIQDIERTDVVGLATMAYYYFDYRDVKKQDGYGLLSSLISQLSAESDSCYTILSQLYSDNTRGIRKPDFNALKDCMKDMLRLPGQGPIYIVVDALDECPNFPERPSTRDEVLELIEELVDLKLPNLHLCAASRPEIDIRTVLEPLTTLKISLHDESRQKEDIIKYIESVVRSDRNMRRWKEDDKRLVVDTLSHKSDGMFRWVVCQADRLCRTVPTRIRGVLNELPMTLDGTYGRALLGIHQEKREFARRLFLCLVGSIRPLRVEELAEVLAIRFPKAAPPTFDAAWRPENAEEAVLSACSSLISIVDGGGHQIVQFSHSSFGEYLTSKRLATEEERLSYYHILPEHAHTILAHSCLSVLLQLDDKIDRDTMIHFPLVRYAARYWVDHAQFRNVSSHIQEAMERLFDPARPHFAAWVWLHDVDRYWTEPMSTTHPTPPEAMPLYYASLCGFRGLVEHLIASHSPDVNCRGGFHTTSLHAALDGGHQGVAMLLLERGADIGCLDSQSQTPLHIACRGCIDVVSGLIDYGVDLNYEDDSRKTSLHVSSQCGHDDIIWLLLDHGADTDRVDDCGWTPLHVASHEGHDKIVQLLFDYGADANRPDNGGWTPLHLASWEGHEHIVQLLLDYGINKNHPDNGGWTPLHVALQEGHNHILELLLNHGADPNHPSSDGSTPLHLALLKNRHDIIQLLIHHGADLNYPNNNGSTSLHLASQRGHDNTVSLLLHHGADANRLDGDGWASLHLASQRGHNDVVEILLKHGADSNHAHSNGLTPLHLASQEGHDLVVQLLLDRGVDTNSLNSDGWAPLHLALQRGHDLIVRLLLKHGADAGHPNSENLTARGSASREGGVERKPPKRFAIATRTRRRM